MAAGAQSACSFAVTASAARAAAPNVDRREFDETATNTARSCSSSGRLSARRPVTASRPVCVVTTTLTRPTASGAGQSFRRSTTNITTATASIAVTARILPETKYSPVRPAQCRVQHHWEWHEPGAAESVLPHEWRVEHAMIGVPRQCNPGTGRMVDRIPIVEVNYRNERHSSHNECGNGEKCTRKPRCTATDRRGMFLPDRKSRRHRGTAPRVVAPPDVQRWSAVR